MTVTEQDVRGALRSLGLAGGAVCVHSSLRSFGRVEGGARAVVDAFVAEGCTLLVPTFSSAYEVAPPAHLRFERNGWDYGRTRDEGRGDAGTYSTDSNVIDKEMGAIPAEVLSRPGRVRGAHPLDSFAGLGPGAAALVSAQSHADAYAPLAALARERGRVLLAGVGLERMTLLHLAEKEAGRALFRRWARDERGRVRAVEAGGCSEGFGKLGASLRTAGRSAVVGRSTWRLFDAAEALALASEAIRKDPRITHCEEAACERCDDAVAGGPVL